MSLENSVNSADPVKITVWIITYNQKQYIGGTLDSILSQKTDFRYEIILHDDASTDGTSDIVREYSEKYPDIIHAMIREKNMYQQGRFPEILDWLISETKGEYVAMCEGDDFWCDDMKLAKQAAALDGCGEYSACVHNTRVLNIKTGEESLLNTRYDGERDLTLDDVVNGVSGLFHSSSVMARSRLLCNIPEYKKLANVSDYPNALTFVRSGRIHYLPDVMSVYRRCSSDTAWSSNNESRKQRGRLIKSYESNINMLECYRKYTDEKYAPVIDKAVNKYRYRKAVDSGHIWEVFGDKALMQLFNQESVKQRIRIVLKALPLYLMLNKK